MTLLRRLGAALALLALVLGVPIAIIVLGGNPLPERWSWSLLLRPDDGGLLVGLVVVSCWLAWAVFTASVVVEAIGVLSRHRIQLRLAGLGGPQRFAALLVLAALAAPLARTAPDPVASMAAAPVASSTVVAGAAGPGDVERPVRGGSATRAPGAAAPRGRVHIVEPGDDLWSLAEQYYGAGNRWRTIAAANPDRLTGGPDVLLVGWRLAIPDTRDEPEQGGTVTVHAGDTLSSIADRVLGAASRWPELFDANRAVLDDPDLLPIGAVLTIPVTGPERTTAEAPPDDADRARTAQSAQRRPLDQHPDPGPLSPPHPATAVPVPPASTETLSSPNPPETPVNRRDDTTALRVATIGGLLAAGLIGGLAARRRFQLRLRPLGRRIPHPPAAAVQVEVELGTRQRPLSLRTLDVALRAISAHCLSTGAPVPRLATATVAADRIALRFTGPIGAPPIGFTGDDDGWLLQPADADYLGTVPGIGEALRPYPALLTAGTDAAGRQTLVNLEELGLLALDGTPEQSSAALSAMAVELSFSPWADELILTLVGTVPELPAALGTHNINFTDDVDTLLDRLESRARAQYDHRPTTPGGHERIDPDLADPWAPEVVLIDRHLSDLQRHRLVALVAADQKPTLGVVVADSGTSAPARLQFAADGSAELVPSGIRLAPQQLSPEATAAVIELVATTGSDETTAAPWWEPPDPPPDNVTHLGRRTSGWGAEATDHASLDRNQIMTDQPTADRSHPVLGLLGPVELSGAAGPAPTRAAKQCLEYCGWLLDRPGTTAVQMANALAVAEGTRRSNMSRLRTWLGSTPDGEPFLPDAYSGRIFLHPSVSSDWQRLQILVAGGVRLTSDAGLQAALGLVRGAPLADAAPGQWHWAEELRTDMISAVRDIGVELTRRAIESGDIDLARWAAARALAAAPGDELLLAARIRTEHLAGNHAETERLTLQVAAHARALGVDLDPETVTLMQRVLEGRVRARLA